MTRTHPHIVETSTVESIEESYGDDHRISQQRIAQEAGGSRLGCSLYTIPPGKTGWPYHYHTANEEAMYVLEGEGTLRIGGEEASIAAGDYVVFPIGPEGAHQLSNPSDTDLRFLAMSTMIAPDIGVHPDTGKVVLITETPPEAAATTDDVAEPSITYLRTDDRTDLWEGEP